MHGLRKWKIAIKDDPRTYASWAAMRSRCLRPSDPYFYIYGGRGITICERWKYNYDAFYEDMGPRPKNTSIERLDNNQGYDPFNCVWAVCKDQSRNRRNNHLINYEGDKITLTECAEKLGLSIQTLAYRVKQGIPINQKLRGPAQCGSLSKYQAGCRCGHCRDAENSYRRMRYAAKKEK